MSTLPEEKAEKGAGKSKTEGPREEKACRFWGSEDGCRKGQDCKFKHDWGGIEKKGRCFGCSATGHSKKDFPEKSAVKFIEEKSSAGTGKGDATDPIPKTGGSDSVEVAATNEGDKGAGASGEMKDLVNEATTLLKSLRPSPAMKTIKLSSLEVRTNDRALLDGGATHCLRTAESEEEWKRAQEVRVELAEGSVTLRQLPWTRTLLTLNETQTIVPPWGR